MQGLYLYCIRKKANVPSSFSTKGIDGEHSAITFTYQDLEAVASEVCLKDFDSEAIQNKAQEDLKWIKEKAVIHEGVVEEAMENNDQTFSLIPMKFGTIFKGEESLQKTLSENYHQFKSILDKLNGKQEWSIKVYLTDKGKLEQLVKQRSAAIKEKGKEIASLPEGMAYFMENELKELLIKEKEREIKEVQKGIFERCKKDAVDAREGKILEKELTGRLDPMVLNASYLIRKEKIEDFKAEAERIRQQISAKGFALEYAGPWPPYNFTMVEVP